MQNGKLNSFAPLTREVLQKLNIVSSTTKQISKIKGLIPQELVFISYGGENLTTVWKETGGKRSVILTDGRKDVILPKMLFIVRNRKLTVLCYKGGLSANTKLYYNPLPNGSADVCLGTIPINERHSPQGIIEEYRRLYWHSTFESKKKEIKKDLSALKREYKPYGKFINSLY